MLPEDDRVRLQHMLDAAKKAVRLAAKGDRRALEDDDDPLADALVHLISVIGEAATKVSPATCSSLDGIPWVDVRRMRNRLIHAYFDINFDILWATVLDDLPTLIRELESRLVNDEMV